MIHDSAIIHPTARIAKNVEIGPWTIIGPDVEIGEGCFIGPHVVINGPTKIGKDNKIFQFASVGEMPQDKKFNGEQTFLEIGDRNVIREFCTINRGTHQDRGTTTIGNDNLLMAYVHVAHDCVIGNHTIFANNASLAGHVVVEDFAIMGGFSGVLQFCRVGAYSFASMGSMINKDVPPYVKVSGYYAKPFGLNSVGMKRMGFSDDSLKFLRKAYKIVYRQSNSLKQAMSALEDIVMHSNEIKVFRDFIQSSERGIVR